MKRDDNDARPFPIQGETALERDEEGRVFQLSPSTIPWWLAEIAYQEYARRFGTDQSLERLAERGGFGRDELLMLLRGGQASFDYDQAKEEKKRGNTSFSFLQDEPDLYTDDDGKPIVEEKKEDE